MTNSLVPTLSVSSSQTAPLLTAANLSAHQRAMAATPSTTPYQGGWACGGEMHHRPTLPKPEEWNELITHDPVAADIDDILRVATNVRQDQGN